MKSTSKLIIAILTVLALAMSAYAQSPREQLQQMVDQLQKTPNDNALRERIVRLGAEIKPAPAIPEEAHRAYVKGGVFKEEAKDASGYDLAISAYRDALRVAPWWGDAYFNLGVTLGLAGKFDEGIASLRLSMASVPAGSAEAREAQNRIYAIEAKAEMASKQAALANAEAERAAQAAKAKAKADETLIVPGERIGSVRIGMTESQVIAAWGSPTKRFAFDSHNGYWGVNLSWGAGPDDLFVGLIRNEGVSTVATGRRGYATANGLSVGSSLSDITAVMGSPGRTHDFGNYEIGMCYSQGIVFYIGQPSKVIRIVVEERKSVLNSCGR